MILVSACLVGENCKYNGKNNKNEKVLEFLEDKEYITICPEVMGGLSTPRTPSEIKGDKVFNKEGKDVTKNFISGAKCALEIAKDKKAELIILKANSPSCGFGKIYDGSFSNSLKDGNGIACQMLLDNGFEVKTEKEIERKI